ncbi:hypothetical protein J5X84_25565 [Streptosporangiaceae bacterium NEAU-GS5]|nr:hypothetical protein [Streptosporangiaceae bacterium NEAU-GS5]
MKRSRLVLALAAAALSAATTLGATAAQAAPPSPDDIDRPIVITDPVPPGFTSWEELYGAQQRINTVADQIEAIAAAPEGAGFGAIVTEPAADRIRLYWKGAQPASLRALLARDTGVSVDLEPAAYTQIEMQAGIERIMAEQPETLSATANQITGAAPMPDAGGLTVFVSRDAASGRELPGVRAAGMPVSVQGTTAPQVAASRLNDFKPYWGGGLWSVFGNAPSCSTGFAVTVGGATKMLSAGHCAQSNGQFAVDGGGQVSDIMGPITKSSDPALDSLLINTSSSGRVFFGDEKTSNTARVVGRHFNHVGDYVCTSGAFSGLRCLIYVEATNVTQTFYVKGKKVGTFNRLVFAVHVDAESAGGNGDSGGPVFEPDFTAGGVWAIGTFTGMDSIENPAPCTGVPASESRGCSWQIWFTSVSQSLNFFGGEIVTG